MSKKSIHSGFRTGLRAAAVAVLAAGLAAGAAVAQERIYVGNTTDSTLTVIDPSTNAQVDLGFTLPNTNGLAASADGHQLYAASSTDFAVIDTTINVIVGSVPIPQGTGAIAVHPNGKFVYTLAPIGSTTLTVLSTFIFPHVVQEVPLNTLPGGIAISPDGRLLYIANIFDGSLTVMSTSTYRSFSIPVNPLPIAVAASPDGAHVYVAHPDFNVLTVVDFGAGSITTVSVPSPNALTVTPDGSRVYVTNGAQNTVTAIDAATNAVIATIPVGNEPFAAAVSAGGTSVYVTNQGSDTTSVISTATNTVVATIPVGSTPQPVVDVVRRGPGSKFECMDGGWQHFTNPSFKNEGDCIAFYNSIH